MKKIILICTLPFFAVSCTSTTISPDGSVRATGIKTGFKYSYNPFTKKISIKGKDVPKVDFDVETKKFDFIIPEPTK